VSVVLTLSQIVQARARIASRVLRTPLESSSTVGRFCGNEVYLKAENLQKTGAFKFRGALNALLSLTAEEGERGVVTASSGNHGQAVACAAGLLGYRAVVVVPVDASEAKVDAIRGYGAEVVACGTTSTERLDKAADLVRQEGMAFVHPYDDERVMAGQGTIGLEIVDILPDVDAVLVPIGGGGLISGVATALKEIRPSIAVYGVEPKQSNSMALSLRAGKRTALEGIETLADGLRTTMPGEKTFDVVRRLVDDVLLVEEEAIVEAMVLLLERAKVLVEPSGAVSVAALLSGLFPLKGKKIVAVLSGGNVALGRLAEILASGDRQRF
jgi:threonine dehydratase